MRALTRRDTRELRRFGLALATLVVVAFGILLPWLGDRPRPVWPLAVGGLLATLALAAPVAVLPLHRLLLPFARLMGVVNTWLLLGLVFFGMLLPLGVVLRRLGRLQYRTGFDREAGSYREPVPADHRTRLEDPF